MTQVFLGLGSNLGDRAANLWEAVRRLSELSGCSLQRVSRLYESEPIGPQDQPWFINCVLLLKTSLSLHELLAASKEIEVEMGRKPSSRWGPRLIDIDLLLYGDETIESHDLVVPHPELWKRRFVLVPLAELVADGPERELMRAKGEELGAKQGLHLWQPEGHFAPADQAGNS